MSDDTLRQAIESAIDTEEKKAAPETKVETPEPKEQQLPDVDRIPPKATGPDEPRPEPLSTEGEKGEKEEVKQEVKTPISDVPPKSWKAGLHEKWKTLDPEVKSEINRRDREITKVFGENNQVREFHKQFGEVVRPFEARMAMFGTHPLEVVRQLLQADAILATAAPVKKAQFMASLIKDYGIDIRELDSALAGEQPADPVQATLERMLNEKLSPLQQFVSQQQELGRQRSAAMSQNAAATVEEMSADAATYPHFEEAREDMADIIEMGAKRGVYYTPQQAYDRAMLMNPDWAAERAQANGNEAKRQQALQQNERAQKALNASSSIRGNASSSPIDQSGKGDSLRSAIEAAWTQVEGR